MSSIITFYSYKGGVGRSMSLANIAFELSKRNKKILIVDWDLEAPGLERYFNAFQINNEGEGLLSLLSEFKKNNTVDYTNYLWTISTDFKHPIYLLPSGREKDPIKYTTELERFNWEDFFKPEGGGMHLENLRNQWLQDFDFVLIDSRTGLSDASGVCTIMLPDVVIPMFTANYQSLFGIRDIMNFIQSSRQRLAVDRMTLTILPLPSRFGTRVEFKESQEWLDRIADILKNCFSDWLPKWIEPRYMLEQIKIPQVDYFSFGEKLAVVEQGTNDPEGMGFIYSKIADFISSDFTDIENFVGKNYFEEKKSYYHYTKELKATEEKKEKKYNYDLFISYPRSVYQWVREVMLPTLTEYLGDELGYKPQIYFDAGEMVPGNDWNDTFKAALEGSKVFIFVFSDSELSSNFLNSDLLVAEAIQKTLKTNILFPVLFRKGYGELNLPPSIFKIQPVDLSSFSKEAITGSTKLNAQFGNVIEQFVQTLASSIREIDKKDQNVIPTEKDIHVEIESLAYAYENLRKQMPSGNTRTRLMQDIVEKMKSKASEAELILPSLTNSSSPGKRLAAIAILQEKPKIEYVDWLADHTGDNEKPFVGYQASVGIYLASRNLIDKKALSGAIDRAFENVDKYPYKDPNQISVLESAKAQLSFKS
ncbi:TIR domain-containing protein [Hanamia caeni]|uniref:TIR domain-containing protein n=1 Tax=Hanamia caeni TaxID=2294116 RepID=A0A3M9NMQ1_9BACT|nr:AAA family ATPase [Hanamia caeni]RNI38944.1 TIR domain-containing protein [Hanamia caeni]